MHRGKVALIRGFGVADRDTRAAVTPKTVFRIGSTTKVLTALGALRMVENGQLNLDQPVNGYLSEFKVPGAITLRQLLSHTSGLAERIALYGPTDPNALRDYVAGLTRDNTVAAPGQVFSYSNMGYNVAGRVIEQVAGRPFAEQIVGDVAASLGMPATTFSLSSGVAQGYKDGQPVRPIPDNGAQYPSGFALSNAQDMARVLELLLTGGKAGGRQVLPSARVREMETPVLGVPPFKEAYGLGLWIKQRRGYQSFGHGGNVDGYTSFLETIPSQQLGVLVLCNQDNFSGDAIMEAALDAVKVPKPRPTPPVETANVADYLGLYEWLSPTDNSVDIYRVYQADDGAHLSYLGGDFRLATLARDAFTVNGVPLAFLRNPDGIVNFLWAIQAAPRLPQPARDVNVPFTGTVPALDAARAVLQPASRAQNDTAAAAARANPALLAFGTANLLEDGAFDELRRCLNALGSVGIRVPAGLDPRNPDHVRRLETVFEIAQEKAVPVLFELGDAQGRTLDAAALNAFADIAAKYAKVRVCVARAGGTGLDPAADLTAARNLVEAYRDHPQAWQNAYLELSGTGQQGAPLVEVLRLWGFNRVLLGGGDAQAVLRLPMRRSERAALLGNDGSGWLGR